MRKIALLLVFFVAACGTLPETPREQYYAAEVVYGQAASAVLSAINRGDIVPGSETAKSVSTTLSSARMGLDSAWSAIKVGNDQLAVNLINTALTVVTDLQTRYAP
jgi:hypothetical protein